MTSLFFDHYPGPLVGITGSSGKTTTTSLVDAIFTAADGQHVLGGNIGRGPARTARRRLAERPAVLEIEPHAAPAHAPQPARRRAAQRHAQPPRPVHLGRLRRPQAPHLRDAGPARHRRVQPRRPGLGRLPYSKHRGASSSSASTATTVRRRLRPRRRPIFWRRDGRNERVVAAADIPLRGRHNVANVAAATAIAAACDIGPGRRRARLCATSRRRRTASSSSRRVRGVDYYQRQHRDGAGAHRWRRCDSFDEPLVLLLGGRDKNLPLDELWRRQRELPRHRLLRRVRAHAGGGCRGAGHPGRTRRRRCPRALRGRRRSGSARRRRPALARLHQLRRLPELRGARRGVSRSGAPAGSRETHDEALSPEGRQPGLRHPGHGPCAGGRRPDLRLQLQLRHRAGPLRRHQLLLLPPGHRRRPRACCAMFFFMSIDYHRLRVLSPIIMLAAVLSLAAVLFIGGDAYGARRWISVGPLPVPAQRVRQARR